MHLKVGGETGGPLGRDPKGGYGVIELRVPAQGASGLALDGTRRSNQAAGWGRWA